MRERQYLMPSNDIGGNRIPLVEVRELSKYFGVGRMLPWRTSPPVKAVDKIDLEIYQGETFGLVGESGCGKTTLGRLIVGLARPTEGEIYFAGEEVSGKSQDLHIKMQIIFQDPYSSLNPSFKVRTILWEAARQKGKASKSVREEDFTRILEQVGLHPEALHSYPHQLSGGQRQRVGIARALILDPQFIVADEPTSALDVSVQAQILNLMIDLQRRMGLTYLFISHDLSVIRYISDRIGVMYLGRIVEIGNAKTVLSRPRHPYTASLLASIPRPDDRQGRIRVAVGGDLPSSMNIPSGCRFHPRCARVQPKCAISEPLLEEGVNGTMAACFFPIEE
jgi:oligopeptide transport system ATP-binding protein